MVDELKIGDVVVLKSGSPNLTVAAIDDDKVTCHWFDKATLRQAQFVELELKAGDLLEGFGPTTDIRTLTDEQLAELIQRLKPLASDGGQDGAGPGLGQEG